MTSDVTVVRVILRRDEHNDEEATMRRRMLLVMMLVCGPHRATPTWVSTHATNASTTSSTRNKYQPDNPLNPVNKYDPDNAFNPVNQYDPGNPTNPINQYNSEESVQPGEPLSSGQSIEPGEQIQSGRAVRAAGGRRRNRKRMVRNTGGTDLKPINSSRRWRGGHTAVRLEAQAGLPSSRGSPDRAAGAGF